VNIEHRKLLNYVLIILLMVAPLRGVVAAHCDMVKMSMQEMDVSSNTIVMHAPMMHDMSAMQSTGSVPADTSKHHCCDDASASCSGVCDLGISFSLMLQEISYSPVYKSSFNSVPFTSKILFRELTPPSRPPATFHS